jgi:hypothetical protein
MFFGKKASEAVSFVPQIENDRAKDQEWARARVKRLRRVEAWLRDARVGLKSGRSTFDDDPWRISKLAEDLIEAIDKGKLS